MRRPGLSRRGVMGWRDTGGQPNVGWEWEARTPDTPGPRMPPAAPREETNGAAGRCRETRTRPRVPRCGGAVALALAHHARASSLPLWALAPSAPRPFGSPPRSVVVVPVSAPAGRDGADRATPAGTACAAAARQPRAVRGESFSSGGASPGPQNFSFTRWTGEHRIFLAAPAHPGVQKVGCCHHVRVARKQDPPRAVFAGGGVASALLCVCLHPCSDNDAQTVTISAARRLH
jgi:hypothetical protein